MKFDQQEFIVHFIKLFVFDRSGNLQPVEYNILSQWYDMFDQMPEFDIATDLTGELKLERKG